VIQPAEEFHREWGGRVAAIAGVDVDLLGRGDEESVRRRTCRSWRRVPARRLRLRLGNSVTNYVSVENYLAMIETVHRFNG